MKKLIFILLMLPCTSLAQAPDSVDITVDGVTTRIKKPSAGEQTTITYGDSANKLEVQVRQPHVPAPPPAEKMRHVKYLSSVGLGVAIPGKLNTTSFSQDMKGTDHINYNISEVKPGMEFRLSLKYTSWKIAPNWFVETGAEYRVFGFTSTGIYQHFDYQTYFDTIVPTFYQEMQDHDSISLDMRKIVNQVSFPVMIKCRLGKNIGLSFGASINLSLTSTRFRKNAAALDGELYKEVKLSGSSYPGIQIQPQLRFDLGRVSAWISFDTGNTLLGYGNADKKTTRFTHTGLSYSLF